MIEAALDIFLSDSHAHEGKLIMIRKYKANYFSDAGHENNLDKHIYIVRVDFW